MHCLFRTRRRARSQPPFPSRSPLARVPGLLLCLGLLAVLSVPLSCDARAPKHHAATDKTQEELADSTAPRSVPDFIGQTAERARAFAGEAGLVVVFHGFDEADPTARVVGQKPAAGIVIRKPGTRVTLELGPTAQSGKFVPDFVGRLVADARAAAEHAGLLPVIKGSTDPKARVRAQSLASGTPIKEPGEQSIELEVALDIGTGRSVPDFIGQAPARARAFAADAGVTLDARGPQSASARVTRQSPEAGTPITRAGLAVTLEFDIPSTEDPFPPEISSRIPQHAPATPAQKKPAR